jgi:2-amino-4-hydroxy-6-hydroxymethyldihydropteridine diphosphokinase
MSEVSRRYVIGLGANLGDRLATLCSAVAALGEHGMVQAVSAVYETAPIGPAQPDFLNAAVLLESMLTPQALLAELLSIERSHGRERRERWGPRTLDLDLLCADDLVLDEPGLSLPHPQLPLRAFALMPLLDVAPEARDARSGTTYAEHLAKLDRHDVRRLETPDGWSAPAGSASLQGERNTSAV